MSRKSCPKRSRTVLGLSAPSDILLSSREHEFTASSWWLVDIESKDVVTQGATPLVKRCMRIYDWDLAKTRRVLDAYRQFLFLKMDYEDWDATQLSPSYLIDQMWHQHILDVTNYCHDMMLLCGHVVGHNPDGAALDFEGKKIRDLNTRDGLEEHFKDNYDKEIWGIQTHGNTGCDAVSELTESCFNPASAGENARKANGELTIRIKDQSGEETFFKVKAWTKMEEIFGAYASRKGLYVNSLRFLFRHEREYSWLLSKIRYRSPGTKLPRIFILPFASFLVFTKKLGRSKGSQHINHVEISSSNGMPIHPAADFSVDLAAF